MHIRPLERRDIAQIAYLVLSAFRNDELYRYLFPKLDEYPEDFIRWQKLKLRQNLVKPGRYGFVAVTDEDEGKVMGYAFFQREAGPDESKDEKARYWIKESLFNKIEHSLLSWELSYHTYFDKTVDHKHVAAYSAALGSSKAFYDSLAPYWHVANLSVDPSFQRRGVGAALVEHGQKLALEDQVLLILESSQPALKMYKKCGFYEIWRGENCGITDVCLVWHQDVRREWRDRERAEEVLRTLEGLKSEMKD